MNKIEQMHYSSVVNIYLDAFKVVGNGLRIIDMDADIIVENKAIIRQEKIDEFLK